MILFTVVREDRARSVSHSSTVLGSMICRSTSGSSFDVVAAMVETLTSAPPNGITKSSVGCADKTQSRQRFSDSPAAQPRPDTRQLLAAKHTLELGEAI